MGARCRRVRIWATALGLGTASAALPAQAGPRPPLDGCRVVVTLLHPACVVEQVLDCAALPPGARRHDLYEAGAHRLTEVMLDGAFVRSTDGPTFHRDLDFAAGGLGDFLAAPAGTKFVLEYTSELAAEGRKTQMQQGRAEYEMGGSATTAIGAKAVATTEILGTARLTDGTVAQTRRLYAPEFGAIVARFALIIAPGGGSSTSNRRPVDLVRVAETGADPVAALQAATVACAR